MWCSLSSEKQVATIKYMPWYPVHSTVILTTSTKQVLGFFFSFQHYIDYLLSYMHLNTTVGFKNGKISINT